MNKTVCFTGHRPNKLNGYDPQDNAEMLIELRKIIIDHINDGYTTFVSGMALGIDMWAAKIVLKLRDTVHPNIKLIAAVPCAKQYSKWKTFDQNEWNSITNRADEVIYVSSDTYTAWCMQKRNEWMVDNSDSVIAVWDGTNGGTANCVKYAQKKGLDIIQLHPHSLDILKGDR